MFLVAPSTSSQSSCDEPARESAEILRLEHRVNGMHYAPPNPITPFALDAFEPRRRMRRLLARETCLFT